METYASPIVYRCDSKSISHHLDGLGIGLEVRPGRRRRHPVHMDEDVLALWIGAHRGQVNEDSVTGVADADFTSTIDSDPTLLPRVRQTIAVAVRRSLKNISSAWRSLVITVIVVG